jgi:hypothetical protein
MSACFFSNYFVGYASGKNICHRAPAALCSSCALFYLIASRSRQYLVHYLCTPNNNAVQKALSSLVIYYFNGFNMGIYQ